MNEDAFYAGTVLESVEPTPEIPGEATVMDAALLMAEGHFGLVAVTVDGELRGIFTERDLTRRVVAAGLDPRATPLSSVMTDAVQTVTASTTVVEALGRCRRTESGTWRFWAERAT